MTKYYIACKTESGWKRIYPDTEGGRAFLWEKRTRGYFTRVERDRAHKRIIERYGRGHTRITVADESPLNKLQGRFGLMPSSKCPATPGVHSSTSYHYQSASWSPCRARDWGTGSNTKAELTAAAKSLRGGAPVGGRVPMYGGHVVRECFGPFGWYIKNGIVYAGAFPNHGDHLHVAF